MGKNQRPGLKKKPPSKTWGIGVTWGSSTPNANTNGYHAADVVLPVLAIYPDVSSAVNPPAAGAFAPMKNPHAGLCGDCGVFFLVCSGPECANCDEGKVAPATREGGKV